MVASEIQIPLGQNIKRLRKQKGWSQKKLAQEIGAHITHFNRIETGKYIPALETVIKLARVLEVPVDYLIGSNESNLEDIRIEDQTFSEKIKLLNSFNEKEREAIITIIDAILTKRKMLKLLKEQESI